LNAAEKKLFKSTAAQARRSENSEKSLAEIECIN
jgi:hypothetical protein